MSSRTHACPRAPSSHDSRRSLSLSLSLSFPSRAGDVASRSLVSVNTEFQRDRGEVRASVAIEDVRSYRSAIRVSKFVREKSLVDPGFVEEELSLSLSLSLSCSRVASFKGDARISEWNRPFATASPQRRRDVASGHRERIVMHARNALARITRRRDCILRKKRAR